MLHVLVLDILRKQVLLEDKTQIYDYLTMHTKKGHMTLYLRDFD